MITQARLKELLCYDENTGVFTWIKYRAGLAKVGYVAGSPDPKGYTRIRIDGVTYKAHSLVFLYLYGHMPKITDHINGVRHDNRACNLREVTHQQNCLNRAVSSRNMSGVKGVRFDKARRKWRACVELDGKKHSGGGYDSKEEAIEAVTELRNRLHGNFARHI